MLGAKSKPGRATIRFANSEILVLKNRPLRTITVAINFDDIYDIVRPLHCHDNGIPSVNQVALCANGTHIKANVNINKRSKKDIVKKMQSYDGA